MSNAKFKHETIIISKRLRMRPIRDDDAQFIWDLRVHRSIYQWTMSGQWLDRKIADDWIKNALDAQTNYNFIIELSSPAKSATADTGVIGTPKIHTDIGSIGLFGDGELGYMIHPAHWKKGYATEAVSAFMSALWEGVSDVQKVTAHVDAENPGSMAVMRKCGFTEVRREKYENLTMGERMEVVFEAVRP